MSEEKKSFILKKTTAGEVFTYVSPMSNPTVSRVIHLTDRVPQQILPLDWALGFIIDQGNYSLYKKGYVTFDDNDSLAKAAVDAGVWFDTFDFTPAKENKVDTILSILKTGNRSKILETIEQYGRDEVANIASHHVEELTTAVVAMLENVLKTQLIID